MPRLNISQTSFTGGELSPRMLGHTDVDRYQTGLKKAYNGHPVLHGGFKRRAGLRFNSGALSNADTGSIIIPFVQGREAAWFVELGNLTCRVYDGTGAVVVSSMPSPYTAAQLLELDWAQSDSVAYLFHPAVPIYMLRNLGGGVWSLNAAPITTIPFAEQGHTPAVGLTLSAATVGTGRTATASASAFLPSDVGRLLTSGPGRALVTGYTSGLAVTVSIDVAFTVTSIAASAWNLADSPRAVLRPTGKEPAEATISIDALAYRAGDVTLSAPFGSITIAATTGAPFLSSDVGKTFYAGDRFASITTFIDASNVGADVASADFVTLTFASGAWGVSIETFRAEDVGSFIRINGGLVKVTARNLITATATIIEPLVGTLECPPRAWSIEQAQWTAANGYPRTGTTYQQRLIAAGTAKYPRTVWGSRVGDLMDFQLGLTDDLAFSFTIDGDESSPISYVSAGKGLVILTQSAEYSMRGGVEKPITATNVRAEPESNHGCAAVRPVSINRETVFVQRAGRKVRAYGYRYDFDGFSSPDIGSLAEHLTKSGLVWMAYQQEPEQMLWAGRADGKLLSCTIDRDQQPSVIGWALHETAGFIEWGCTIPGDSSDQLWLLVRRTINGASVRYIERLDAELVPFHASVATVDSPVYGCTTDSARVFDNASGQTVFSVPHLAGATVDVVADGTRLTRRAVGVDGAVTIERAGKRVSFGLPFRTEGTLLNPEVATQNGSAQGQPARTSQMIMRFLDTIGAFIRGKENNRQEVPFRRFGADILDAAPEPFTGLLKVSLLGWDRGDSEITVIQEDPYPMHLLSVVRTHQVNG